MKGKIRYFTLRYKNKTINLGYCNYKNYKWSCTNIDNHIFITINNNYSLEDKRKIINKILAESFLAFNLFILSRSIISRLFLLENII